MGKLTYVIQNLHYYTDLYKPTLANVIEQAYERRITAESVPSFCTVTEAEFNVALEKVEKIRRAVNQAETLWFLPSKDPESLGGYWGFIIPRMILIYAIIKRAHVMESDVDWIIAQISSFGQPLADLIIDFYQDSHNPVAQRILMLLQSNKEA